MKLRYPPRCKRTTPMNLTPTEPMLIRLTEDVGKLPAGFVYFLPRFESEILIMRRKAVAVADLAATADIKLTELECREAGLGA